MRFRSDAEEDDYSLQLTPLIDVVFLLLIFFMVSTSFVDFTRRIDIELPEAKSGVEVVEKKPFLVEVGAKEANLPEREDGAARGYRKQAQSGDAGGRVPPLPDDQGGQAPRLRLCDSGDGPHLPGGRPGTSRWPRNSRRTPDGGRAGPPPRRMFFAVEKERGAQASRPHGFHAPQLRDRHARPSAPAWRGRGFPGGDILWRHGRAPAGGGRGAGAGGGGARPGLADGAGDGAVRQPARALGENGGDFVRGDGPGAQPRNRSRHRRAAPGGLGGGDPFFPDGEGTPGAWPRITRISSTPDRRATGSPWRSSPRGFCPRFVGCAPGRGVATSSSAPMRR